MSEARLIDANALLLHECEADRMGAMLVVGKGYILDAPTVEPPVVHGEWIRADDWTDQCSICGEWHENDIEDRKPYCSMCGARMDGHKKEEEE